ncbi:hypothetical protein [Halalkalibacter alkaliphilus]|uniref:Uncharacterized protein n=1 Tax=Halalkalibacter alkaliphilus TaxID=2917993 RepID=A0A9X2CW82_9BACI|nr:hypothetical protein [Halalkalibacter alkaliphilus]MCL7749460.1 hypothetical protein [Halalkalibacter alkaliphilus]
MKDKEKLQNEEPTIATGIDDDEELSEKATQEEIERGDSTRVVTLSWDEDPR